MEYDDHYPPSFNIPSKPALKGVTMGFRRDPSGQEPSRGHPS